MLKDDHISREAFANVATATIIQTMTPEDLRVMVLRGFDEFLLHARRIYAGHAFYFEDYKRMFECLSGWCAGKITLAEILRPLR